MFNKFARGYLFCSKFLNTKLIMHAENDILLRILSNENLIQNTTGQYRAEIIELTSMRNTLKAKLLREENAELQIQVKNAKSKLIALEKQNGVQHVPLPGERQTETTHVFKCETTVASDPIQVPQEKKVVERHKAAKQHKKPAPITDEAPIDVGRLDLRIGLVEDVKLHPDADTLYVLLVNCPEQRTVCSGLVAHVPMASLANRLVVVLCNLKPAKMRGIISEAMIMCASANVEGGSYKVEVLTPPKSTEAGDRVTCDGYKSVPDAVLNPKKKIWESVAPDLATDEEFRACYKGVPLVVVGKGTILAETLKNAAVK